IPKLMGCSIWLSSIICLVVGMLVEDMVKKIVFSRAVQKKSTRRFMALAAIAALFLAAWYLAAEFMKMDLSEHLAIEFIYVIIPPVIVFAFRMVLRWYRSKKIHERYGDGSGGFMFDDMLKKDKIDEFNRQNQQIHGGFDSDCSVKTKNGTFVGKKVKNSLFFYGIPYAKPPIGELRWKAPEPLPESDEVFEAKYFGASAIQADYEGSLLKHHRQSEDCLTLNVCAGYKKTGKKQPVIVIFHHGDFSYGSSADPLLSADNFLKIYPDTVCVTFNYRLGILGFIDFSEVPGGDEYPDAINLGLLDQIAALRWIKENISAFGGDPEKITVMGFEAGTISISLLAACEKAKGLFQKAFMFHGSPFETYETPKESRNFAKKLMQETSTTTMNELVNLSAGQLKEASQKLMSESFAPTLDGKLIPADVYAAYRAGLASGIEFIIGIPSNETRIYKSSVGNEKYGNFMYETLAYILNYLDTVSPEKANDVRTYIEEQTAVTSKLEAKASLVEQFYSLMTYYCAKKLAESGNKVHLLYWDVKPLIEKLGSGTVDVAAAFLGNSEAAQMYGDILNHDISGTLQNLFRKFKDGEPMRLYNNEIKGIAAIDWKKFPQALIVSEKSFQLGLITDRLTEIKSLKENLS
ncbi:MAG: carboxylesterase family protein, partial [Synergistaceae bacterium]|nr:carboxylesterase family protein [Synergistaceae bacterium]